MSNETFERGALDGKDREQLQAIAGALGLKAVSRLKKAELVDAILGATTARATARSGPATASERRRPKPRKIRSTRRRRATSMRSPRRKPRSRRPRSVNPRSCRCAPAPIPTPANRRPRPSTAPRRNGNRERSHDTRSLASRRESPTTRSDSATEPTRNDAHDFGGSSPVVEQPRAARTASSGRHRLRVGRQQAPPPPSGPRP